MSLTASSPRALVFAVTAVACMAWHPLCTRVPVSWASAWLPASLGSGHCSNATCSEKPFLATLAAHLCYFSPPALSSFSSKHLSPSAELFICYLMFLLENKLLEDRYPDAQVSAHPAHSWYPRVSGLPKGMFTILESEMTFTSSPQPFWHQRPVSWKTIFPQNQGWGGGWFGDNSSKLHLLCTLFLLLLHQPHLRSSGVKS